MSNVYKNTFIRSISVKTNQKTLERDVVGTFVFTFRSVTSKSRKRLAWKNTIENKGMSRTQYTTITYLNSSKFEAHFEKIL